MSRYDAEDEQVAALKNWWNKHGTQLLSGLLVVVVAWTGWTYWSNAKLAEAMNASAVFEVMQVKQQQNGLGDVLRDGLKLMDEQPESPYASGVALMIAKHYLAEGEKDKAVENLNWVVTHAPDQALQFVAQLRLVQLYIGTQELQAAQTTLNTVNRESLSQAEKAQYDYQLAELSLVQDEKAAARAAFQKVLDNPQAPEGLMNLARLKLDDLTV
ncbi:MAG: YfgM family protein [Hydrogenovibrio sp.]